MPSKWFVRVTDPLNVWGVYTSSGLCMALDGKKRSDAFTAMEFLIANYPDMKRVILEDGSEVQVYPKKPEGIKLTPWPKGKPLPDL